MAERKGMRTGYTTGSCATAASKAALLSIIGQERVKSVDITLPKGGSISIPIESCEFWADRAVCAVVKDGGDDPDVTHGARILVELSLGGERGEVSIGGGEGVGTVTKPGLGLEINGPAINPVPKRMIDSNLREVGGGVLAKCGVRVMISVPDGKRLAPKTDNPRIGIVGGISILGTSGIVVPFSTASYAASIRQNIDVAAAMGDHTLVLTTGGRSEEFAKKLVDLPEHCFVQMGDFAGYTMQQCAKRRVEKAYVVGFIGKLAKMAAGAKQTHVKGSKVDMDFLAGLAGRAGADAKTVSEVRRANTARHVSEIIQGCGADGFFGLVCDAACEQMGRHAGNKVPLEVVLFGFGGEVLARSGALGGPSGQGILSK